MFTSKDSNKLLKENISRSEINEGNTEYFRFGNMPATAKLAMKCKNKYHQPVRNLPAPRKTP